MARTTKAPASRVRPYSTAIVAPTRLTEAGNPDFTIITLPDANHSFQTAYVGTPEQYGQLGADFAPGFLDTLTEWISARTGVPSSSG